jgi:hypothetical protein
VKLPGDLQIQLVPLIAEGIGEGRCRNSLAEVSIGRFKHCRSWHT